MCSPLRTLVCLPGRRCVLCLPGVFVFAVEQRAARTTGTCVIASRCVVSCGLWSVVVVRVTLALCGALMFESHEHDMRHVHAHVHVDVHVHVHVHTCDVNIIYHSFIRLCRKAV